MSNCNSCPSKGTCGKQADSCGIQNNERNKIRHVIGVMSGKGGVGKSSMSVLMAKEMARRGFRVGIMDADITGPSIPKMYGLKGAAMANDEGIYPMITKNGIKVMSINLLLPTEDTPVIWRGPVLANMVKQFWTDVVWGELD